jgi:hypothetical protein
MPNDHQTARINRRMVGVAAAAIALIGLACSEVSAPSAPQQSPRSIADAHAAMSAAAASLPNSFVAQGLLRQKPLDNPVVVTKVIPSGGGKIDVPGTDFELQIPKGAFEGKSMTFTVKALPGYAVAYQFEPHGAEFLVPLKFVQHLGHTNLHGFKPPKGFTSQLSGAYFTRANLVDPLTGLAVVSEFLPADLTWDGDQISFPIWHFSGYMVSTGREEQ